MQQTPEISSSTLKLNGLLDELLDPAREEVLTGLLD